MSIVKRAGIAAGVMAGVALVTSAFNGFAFDPRTEFGTMLWCMPFLVLYLLAIGTSTRLFADKVRAQKRELEQGSRIDAQTGLATRPQWLALVAAELRRFHRYGAVSSLLMVDIDRFKQINSRYLLSGGDHVLIWLGQTLAGTMRATDALGRVGGEEFMVVAPGTDAAGAKILAERLRETVATSHTVYRNEPIRMTISVGFAVAAPDVTIGYDQLREVAAVALAEAKADGRDRSVIRKIEPGQK